MTARPSLARRGLTMIELVGVLAVLIILGAVLVPTLSGIQGDTRAKAGADVLQAYIAKARAQAVEHGTSYRLAISADGKRVRIAPDTFESLGEMPNPQDDDDTLSGPVIREDDLPEGVLAVLVLTDDDYVAQDQSGWKRVATFLPDGTCREDSIELRIEEVGVAPVLLKLRGITGVCTASRGEFTP